MTSERLQAKILKLDEMQRRRGRGRRPPGDDDRPAGAIRIVEGELPRIVDEMEAALAAAGATYVHGGRLVRVVTERTRTFRGGETHATRFSEVTAPHLVDILGRAAGFERWDDRAGGFAPCDCRKSDAETLLARDGMWRLPPILGVVNAPTMRHDGTLLQEPGYDAASGLLYDPRGTAFPRAPEDPTGADAEAALGALRELLREFPFARPADRAVALSALLTSMVRRSIATAPLHAFTAPEAGTGKSLLVDLCSVLATGERAAVTSTGRDRFGDAELEKRLVASMLAAEQMLTIDNVDHPLGGALLCQLLTQHKIKLRPLGRSVNVEVPVGTMFFATGNNLRINDDAVRRVLMCKLDAGCERPETREFERDVMEYARAGRGRLAVAALTVLRAFVCAGSPRGSGALGSFEEWSALVRGALIWLGEEDPVSTMDETRRNDPRRSALADVAATWAKAFGERVLAVRDVVEAAGRRAEADGGDGWLDGDLRFALLAVAKGDRGEVDPNRLGNWLRRNQDRVVTLEDGKGELRFTPKGTHAGSTRWCLEMVRAQGTLGIDG